MAHHRPNIDQAARDLLEDLAPFDDDRTEDLRVLAVGEGSSMTAESRPGELGRPKSATKNSILYMPRRYMGWN